MSSPRILVVDDEPAILMIIGELLRRKGLETTRVATGEEAWTRVTQAAQPFDLAVVDVNLPGMGGLEFARRLAGASPRTKVLLTSGNGTEAAEGQGLRPGTFDALGKPFLPDDLLAKVAGLLGSHGTTASRPAPQATPSHRD